MVLRFKNRAETPRKKILVYGLDGSGKSTFAYNYCEQYGLTPVVIDVDDTNFTPAPILELNFGSDLQTYKALKEAIQEIGKTDDFDTIIIDGVTSLLEMLVSKSKGMSAYSDRSKRWNDILFKLDNTKKNLIFVGQIDMEMLFTDDYQPSKAIIKVNSLVNEKYKTFVDDKGNYSFEVKKMRTLEQIEAEYSAKIRQNQVEAEVVEDSEDELQIDPLEEIEVEVEKTVETAPRTMDTAREVAESIVAELPKKNMLEAKKELARLLKLGVISADECKGILAELERVL